MSKFTLAAALAVLPILGIAQTVGSLGAGGYAQGFDTLPTGAPVLVGNPGNLGTALNPALNGLFVVQTGPNPNLDIIPTDAVIPNPGDTLAGGLLSFARPVNSPDRALGFFASQKSGTVAAGLRLRNDGPSALSSLTLSFVLEQYLEAGSATFGLGALNFSYRQIAPGLSDAAFAGLLGSDAGWLTTGFETTIRDGSGGFLSSGSGAAGASVFAPRSTNGTPVPLDGNAANNRRLVESLITLDSPIAVGGDIAIRFADDDDPFTDPGIGLDTLGVRPGQPVPEPSTLAAMSIGLWGLIAGRRRMIKADSA